MTVQQQSQPAAPEPTEQDDDGDEPTAQSEGPGTGEGRTRRRAAFVEEQSRPALTFLSPTCSTHASASGSGGMKMRRRGPRRRWPTA